jgi:hypothetical protein
VKRETKSDQLSDNLSDIIASEGTEDVIKKDTDAQGNISLCASKKRMAVEARAVESSSVRTKASFQSGQLMHFRAPKFPPESSG